MGGGKGGGGDLEGGGRHIYGGTEFCIFLCFLKLSFVLSHSTSLLYSHVKSLVCIYKEGCYDTGRRRCTGYLKLHVIFSKKATDYRALLRKKMYKDNSFYGSSPPCTLVEWLGDERTGFFFLVGVLTKHLSDDFGTRIDLSGVYIHTYGYYTYTHIAIIQNHYT